MMTSLLYSDVWPEPTFKVYSFSGRYVGYGSCESDGIDVYSPGGDDEGIWGTILGSDIFFSNGELAGRVSGERILYADGETAGRIEGSVIVSSNGSVAGYVEGSASSEASAGAVLLLILNRWFDAKGNPNPELA